TGDHIDGAVESWLEKFVSGSPKALKQVVDDGRADAAYMPLKNVRSVEFSVEGTGIPDLPDTRAEDATEVIARVELKIVWLKTPAVESAEEITTITYDLLIDRVDTSTPRVVSWG